MIKYFFNKSEFLKNVVTLLAGTTAAQIITFSLYPILTRIYSPIDFGLLGLFVAIVIILSIAINGGYEPAVMLPAKDSDAFHIVVLCGIINVSGVFLMYCILFFFKDIITETFHIKSISSWLIFLPLSIFLEGNAQPIRTLLSRFKQFSVLSYGRATQAVVTGIVSLIFGFTLTGAWGLLIGYLSGQFIYSLICYVKYFQLKRQFQFDYSKENLLKLAKTYRTFPKYSVIGSWLNTSSHQLPFLILAPYFGSEVVGLYALAQKVLFAPISLIGNSVTQVFYQRAKKANEEGPQHLAKLTRDVFKYMLLLILGPVLVMLFFAPPLFSFVFGTAWIISGNLAQWMAPWLLGKFILFPLSYLIDIKNKLKSQFVYNICLFACQLIALLLGSIYLNIEYTVGLYTTVGAVLVTLYLIYLLRIGGVLGSAKEIKPG